MLRRKKHSFPLWICNEIIYFWNLQGPSFLAAWRKMEEDHLQQEGIRPAGAHVYIHMPTWTYTYTTKKQGYVVLKKGQRESILKALINYQILWGLYFFVIISLIRYSASFLAEHVISFSPKPFILFLFPVDIYPVQMICLATILENENTATNKRYQALTSWSPYSSGERDTMKKYISNYFKCVRQWCMLRKRKWRTGK